MENPYEYEKRQTRKLRTIATITASLITLLLIWIIVAAVTSSHPTGENSTLGENNAAISDNPDDAHPEPISATTDPNSPTETETNSSVAASDTSTSSSTSEIAIAPVTSTPETGPTDLLLTALLAGASTALLLNFRQSRKQLALLAEK